jgi:hypothetical protein
MCSYLIYFYVLTHDPTLKSLYSQFLLKQRHLYLQNHNENGHEERVSETHVIHSRDAPTRPEDPTPLLVTSSEQMPGFYPPLPLNSPSSSPFAGTVTTAGINDSISPLSFNSIGGGSGFGSSPGYVLSPQQIALQRMWQQQQQQAFWQMQQRQQNIGGPMPLPLSPTNSIAASVYSQRTSTTVASAPPQPKEL